MNSFAVNTLRRSGHFVLSVALVLTTVLSPSRTCHAQQLQQGISVQLAVTSSAAPMPDADKGDALIVSVTDDGSFYFGISPVTPADLAEKLERTPSHQDKEVYIKADARTPYANVIKILEAAHTAGVTTPILLTTQAEPSQPGSMVSPKGLEVLVVPPSGSQSTVVQVIDSGQPVPTLRINNRQIPWANLQSMLTQLFQNRPEKVVLVKADGHLPFADLVHVIDTCHSAGAKVVLATTGL